MIGGEHPRGIRTAARAAVAGLGLGAILFTGAGTAGADDDVMPSDHAPVTGRPSTVDLGSVVGEHGPADVSQISLGVEGDDQRVLAYCIDLETGLRTGKVYVEGDWDTANPHSDMPHIQWVLEHSYPLVSAADVLAAAGVQPRNEPEKVAYLATQAAVWHFSDGFELSDSDRNGDSMRAVYEYLTGPDNDGSAEPAPSLSIEPDSASGEAGAPIGPLSVNGTVDDVTLSVSDGATLVNADGDEIDRASAGDQFNVLLDSPGEATVTASGTGSSPAGRIFVFQEAPDEGQKLVLASPATVEVSAEATVTATEVAAETPGPTEGPSAAPKGPELANTGASVWPKVGIGGAMVVVGAGLVFGARVLRRRTT